MISEKLAEEGDVDGSMVKMAEAEALQQKWKELLDSYTQPDRTMSVCEICGVFVQSTDNEQRRLVCPLSPVGSCAGRAAKLVHQPMTSSIFAHASGTAWSSFSSTHTFGSSQVDTLGLLKHGRHTALAASCSKHGSGLVSESIWSVGRESPHGGVGTVQEHIQGKQYLGWSAIREKLGELHAKFGAAQPERPRSKDMDRDRERERERECPR